MTVNSRDKRVADISREAQLLGEKLRRETGDQSAPSADDVLLFLYRLRDEYLIARSTSQRFKGPSFAFLHELLYQLESRPDETLKSEEWRSLIETLLKDLTTGKLILARKKR